METSSAKRDIVVDLNQIAWKQAREGGRGYHFRVCLEGGADGREAMQVRLPGLDVPPHFHHASRYQLLLKGSVTVDGKRLEAESLRFVQGNEPEVPLVCGPEGATFMVLSYDQDAARGYGGKAMDDVRTAPEPAH